MYPACHRPHLRDDRPAPNTEMLIINVIPMSMWLSVSNNSLTWPDIYYRQISWRAWHWYDDWMKNEDDSIY